MGSFGDDTAVTGSAGRYTATLDDSWAIWGPAGGYIAGVALRAAGAESSFGRPANCAVHFLGVARFAPVEVTVEVVKRTRRTESLRVLVHQDDKLMLQLICWGVTDDALPYEHLDSAMPLPAVDTLPTLEDRLAEEGVERQSTYGFWNNFEERPTEWIPDWANRPALDPRWHSWLRFVADEPTDDRWLEAAKLLLLADLGGWPAANRAYAPDDDARWYAPTIDVACQFADVGTTDWFGIEHHSPVGREGLMNANSRLWSADGRLLCTAVTQLIATEMRPHAERP